MPQISITINDVHFSMYQSKNQSIIMMAFIINCANIDYGKYTCISADKISKLEIDHNRL